MPYSSGNGINEDEDIEECPIKFTDGSDMIKYHSKKCIHYHFWL